MTRNKRNRSPVPLLLIALGGVILLGALIALAVQSRSGTASAPTAASQEEETYPEIQRITLDEVKTAFDAGKAVFLDVRSPSSFAAGHIPGARSIPLNELETRLSELNPDDWIITYCT